MTKLEIELLDQQTKEKILGANLELYEQQADGTLKKVREFTTGQTNYLTTRLAVGNYVLRQPQGQKESLLDKGYVTLEDVEFTLMDSSRLQKLTVEQHTTKLTVNVTDAQTAEAVKEAKMEIFRKMEDGKLVSVRQFTTKQEEPYYTERLAVGSYVLKQQQGQKEALLDQGYVTQNDVSFEIADTKQLQQLDTKQEVTKLEIEVIDNDTKERLPGVKFEIYQKKQEELVKVREFITKEQENYTTDRLAVGDYILRQVTNQKEALYDKGYITNPDIAFTIIDRYEVQKLPVQQQVSKLAVEVVDKDNQQLQEGIVLQLVQEAVGIEEQVGQETTKQVVIQEWTTTDKPAYFEKLPLGNYILQQKQVKLEEGQVHTEPVSFTLEDKQEQQTLQMQQAVTKLELEVLDQETKEKIAGVNFSLYRVVEGKEELIKDLTTQEENLQLERLAVGEYILKQKEEGLLERGYIRLEDIRFAIMDTVKTQKVQLEQETTKVEVVVLDKKTQKPVEGAKLIIQDEKENAVSSSWNSGKQAQKIARLPVGTYYLVEQEAPTKQGYVLTQKQKFEVTETNQVQTIAFLQDYTQVDFHLVDEISQEEIGTMDVFLKDETGKQLAKLTIGEKLQAQPEKKQNQEKEESEPIEDKKEIPEDTMAKTKLPMLEKLPIGTYHLESASSIYGYKAFSTPVVVKNQQGIQEHTIRAPREEFDMQIEKWVKQIHRNDKQEYHNEKLEQKVRKLDIKDKNIRTEQVKITYQIRISNSSKVNGEVGKVEITIPQGMRFVKEDSAKGWKEENGKVVQEELKGKPILPGNSIDLDITFQWKNGLENFGTKQAIVQMKEVKSDIGFEESNQSNNRAQAADVIIGVGTGQMNLVYGCWAILILLIIAQVVMSKKLKIRPFKLKDKTLKYKK